MTRKQITRKAPSMSPLAMLLLVLMLLGCTPASPTAAINPSAPSFIDPIPSPTHTPSLPEPDDPIADCALDVPLCVIDVGLVGLGGEAYLGVDVQVSPGEADAESEAAGPFLLDADVSLQRDGATISQIERQGSTVAIGLGGGRVAVTTQGGTSLVEVSTNQNGVVLISPKTQPGMSTAYDPLTEDLVIYDADGNPVAIASPGGVGVMLADPRPSPIIWIPFQPGSMGLLSIEDQGESTPIDLAAYPISLYRANGQPAGSIESEEGGLRLYDASGGAVAEMNIGTGRLRLNDRRGAALANLGLWNGLVVIAQPGIDPLALESSDLGEGLPNGPGVVNLLFVDGQGEPAAGVGLVDGLVVIAQAGVGPVVLVSPNYLPSTTTDPEDVGLRFTMLIPFAGIQATGTYDLAGTAEVYSLDDAGMRQSYSTMTIKTDGEQIRQVGLISPKTTPTPSSTGAATKSGATADAPKPTLTPEPPKPTATSKPPTAEPTKEPSKPTPTPEK